MTTPARPTPLRSVAQDVSLTVGIVGSLVTSLVGYGIFTIQQGDAVTGLLGLIPGLVTGGTAAWVAFKTAHDGEAHVTPVSDPAALIGNKLVPLVPETDTGKHSLG